MDDPATELLDSYPRGMKTCVHTKFCKWVFRIALFVIAKQGKQPRSPSMGVWLNQQYKDMTADLDSDLDQYAENYTVWKKPSPQIYILHNFLYITILKWQNRRSGLISGCQRLRKEWVWEGSGCIHKRATWGIHVVMGMFCTLAVPMSASCLWYRIIVLQDVIIRGSWLKDTWDLFGFFLTTECSFIMILKQKTSVKIWSYHLMHEKHFTKINIHSW